MTKKVGRQMKKIAKFEKVSRENFVNAWLKINDDKNYIDNIYDAIRLPKRATVGSAGYDIFAPDNFLLNAGESITIPTGIRVKINNGWVLKLYPRSGLGFKYRLQLNNTVGIIDSDYYYSDNEGHIYLKLTNDSRDKKNLEVLRGDAFCQGIFVEYGITFDDDTQDERNGGFGSTDKVKV
jgi:dUTP pyrophosphatase